MKNQNLLAQTAAALDQARTALANQPALIGFDGFVDEIVRMVDKRTTLQNYTPIATLSQLAERIAGAAERGTNIELVVERMKLGGNGPIMANALATFGAPVTYIGNLGYPSLHPVFAELAQRATVISIANPGHTDAVEFADGKVMLGKLETLNEITWETLIQRMGAEKLTQLFSNAHLISLNNWTMIPFMSDIWQKILRQICPHLPATSKNRLIFFDLADPAKRLPTDIRAALELIAQFKNYFKVILGTNEKESFEIADVLGVKQPDNTKTSMLRMAQEIRSKLGIYNVVVHPIQYALAASADEVKLVDGPWEPNPLISTGAGDHFNAGFCLGRLLGFDLEQSLLAGVTTSGFYVRTAQSPAITDLITFMQNWPT